VEKAAVEASLAEPAIYENKEKLQQYIFQQVQLVQQLQRAEEKWLEITEALELMAH
jgi:ATP-binding cassette subfamily F protein 3